MDVAAASTSPATPTRPGHRRNKSASVFKSIMTSKSHKRTPSDGLALDSTIITKSTKPNENIKSHHPNNGSRRLPVLPAHHLDNQQRVLGEIQNESNNPPSPRKTSQAKEKEEKAKTLHKKTKSAISLKSLAREKDKEKGSKDARKRDGKEGGKKPKKSKSSTSLSAVFARSKSAKDRDALSRDKENTTPPSSASMTIVTPIWAEFASQPFSEVTTTTNVPLNDQRTLENEISRYTPKDYSPSKQRNFGFGFQPSLQRRSGQRPKSEYLPSSASTTSFIEALSRKASNDHTSTEPEKQASAVPSRRSSGEQSAITMARSLLRRTSGEQQKNASNEHSNSRLGLTMGKKGAKIVAAVAALHGKAKVVDLGQKVDPKAIDAEFEALLDSRNIPESMRPQLLAVSTRVKADLIKQNKESSQSSRGATSKFSFLGEATAKRDQLSKSSKSSSNEDDTNLQGEGNDTSISTKRSRPRSKTFTFSRGASPSKKQVSENANGSHRSTKSIEIPKSPSTKNLVASLGKSSGVDIGSKVAKPAVPNDFVSYLRVVKKPQEVEVGKLHKLRLLLRNETVTWVDTFIRQGGMTELVELLHRIIQVEWREDHEDTLLHEVLLCLKGLSTTDRALKELAQIESTLFPALLAMLFDEEHKGPSEFTTRGLIMSLLSSHLSAASAADLPSRARTILSYLQDPPPPADKQPLPFILEMRQPRPYRVWCREVVNVTKEVFWIFLHHLNVVPLPGSDGEESAGVTKNRPNSGSGASPEELKASQPSRPPSPRSKSQSYAQTYFPRPRPPVPAAPYVGGVEWDSTNYISTHLDLLNGLLASLPSREERNKLRLELRASGWEKVMGGSLRTCKEKFYGSVHDGLRTWVAAAAEDGWEVRDVRFGPKQEEISPRKSPKKGGEKPPQIEAPKLDPPKMDLPKLGLSLGTDGKDGGWV